MGGTGGNDLPTFIAKGFDLEGLPVQREVTAVDKHQAFEQLEREGLTSIRLRELVNGDADEPQLLGAPVLEPFEDEEPTVVRRAQDRKPLPRVSPEVPQFVPQWPTIPMPPPETVSPQTPDPGEAAARSASPPPAPSPPGPPSTAPPPGSRLRSPEFIAPTDTPRSSLSRPSPVDPVTRPLTEASSGRAAIPPLTASEMRWPISSPGATSRNGSATPRTKMLAALEEPAVRQAPEPRFQEAPAEPEPRPTRLVEWLEDRWDGARQAYKRLQKPVDPQRRRMNDVDRMAFFSGLGSMLTVGIPMVRAVSSMQEQFVDPVSRASMGQLIATIRQGKPLSVAMGSMPKTFSRLQIGSVRGAENAGNLPLVLARLHRYEERTLSLTRQVRAQMSYPLLVFACAFVLVLFVGRSLLTGMIPVMAQAKLKMSTSMSIVLSLAKALDHPLVVVLIVGGFLGAAYALLRWLQTEPGQGARDRFLMHAPIVRKPLRKVETGRMCEAVATLYRSGLPLLQCLDVAGASSPNVVVRESFSMLGADLREGKTLAQAMARVGFFDRTVVQLVYVGEVSGKLEMAFTKIAQYNDIEVRSALEQFAAAIEPVMMVVLGAVVGVIALIAFAPLYQLVATL